MCLFKLFRKKKKAETQTAKTETVNETKVEVKAEEVEVKEAPQEAPKETPKAETKKETPKAKSTKKTAEEKAVKPKEKKTEEKAEEVQKEEVKKDVPEEKEKLTGRFEIKKTKDDRYVFNLYASNKIVVATSQTYASARAAIQGINSVINNAETAPVEDQTLKNYETKSYPKWEIYKDKGEEFRFRLNATNGQTICHSQGYTTKANCKKGIDSIIRSSRNAEIDKAYLEN